MSNGRDEIAFAVLDSETGQWLDANGKIDLFQERLPLFSGTWPSSGSMRSGRVYEHPTSVPRTPDSESSSSRGLLRTPAAAEAEGGPRDRNRPGATMRLSDQIREEMEDGRIVVSPADKLFPTPSAAVMNDGESLESWEARRDRIAEKGYNGNGMGMPLTIAVQSLLPTPLTDPDTGNGHARYLAGEVKMLPTPSVSNQNGNQRNGRGEDLLPGVVEKLLPTPTVALADGGQKSRSGDRSNELLLSGLAVEAASRPLLPTPNAALATSGPDHARVARGAGGDDLATKIALLPTTTAMDSEASGNGAGVTLTDVLQRERRGPVSDIDWGEYAHAIRQWEQITGRPAPSPVRFDGRDGNPRLNPEFTEWMMGWPAGWLTDPVIGLSRAQQLRAAGNGVVTLQAIFAIRLLLTREGVPSVR